MVSVGRSHASMQSMPMTSSPGTNVAEAPSLELLIYVSLFKRLPLGVSKNKRIFLCIYGKLVSEKSCGCNRLVPNAEELCCGLIR